MSFIDDILTRNAESEAHLGTAETTAVYGEGTSGRSADNKPHQGPRRAGK